MEYRTIQYAVDDAVATITLHRPDKMNAFTSRMCHELLDALDQVDGDDAVRAVIVTGSGRAFCAGADLGSGGGSFDNTDRASKPTIDTHRDEGGLLTLRIYDCKKPIIAAMNGAAVGVGVTMTLPMDIRIGVPGSKMGFVFARRGIVPEAASSWFLTRAVGIQTAAEWAYTGRIFRSEEALEAGLLYKVVPPEELLPTARGIAREIADNTAPVSVALTRQMFWKMLGASSPHEAHLLDSKAVFWTGRQPDAYEGVQSFLEKRPAKFSMKPSTGMPPFYPWWKE
ncbi:MAG: crotonase/enoyl-CoA hydratase family protein [Candidatus Binatia bacterium]|nr:crotonase/enoyl-CoA hydratase family protein [Candidatus Binatia bacterium]